MSAFLSAAFISLSYLFKLQRAMGRRAWSAAEGERRAQLRLGFFPCRAEGLFSWGFFHFFFLSFRFLRGEGGGVGGQVRQLGGSYLSFLTEGGVLSIHDGLEAFSFFSFLR